jgi:hypothetical protein
MINCCLALSISIILLSLDSERNGLSHRHIREPVAGDLEGQIADAVRALDELAATQTYDLFRTSGGATLAKGLRAALTLARASAGECRRSLPYSSLRPVLDVDNQVRWCCSHDPEHCG